MNLRREHGFTLIEVLVAMTVLVIGVLGAVSLLDRANATVSLTQSHDDATNLAREVIETARGVPYAELAPGSLQSRLQTEPGLSDDSASPGWQIRRRQTTYTVKVTTCVYDDPKDGAGTHDGTFCADSATADPPTDKNPEDYKRVRADLSWTVRGVTREVHQIELINNPGSSGATAVRTLQLSNPTVGIDTIGLTSPPLQSADFTLTTSSTPAALHWLLDGAAQGPITTGSGQGWSFSWPLGDPTAAGSVVDGTYVVSAEAFNAYNQVGPSKSFTVRINRRAPELVSGVAGGRSSDPSGSGSSVVYVEWLPNRDLDITGYSVFRRDASGPTEVCHMVTTDLRCVDKSPPATDPLHYYVVAYDLDDAGNQRAGAAPGASGDLVVTGGNTPPNPVQNLSASADADGNVTLTWDRATVPDPDPGDGVDFYRIYRDGIAVGDPYARWDDTGAHITWVDSDTGGTAHRYWVTAVDQHYGESTPVGPVTP